MDLTLAMPAYIAAELFYDARAMRDKAHEDDDKKLIAILDFALVGICESVSKVILAEAAK